MKVFISCSLLGHVNIFSKAWGGRGSDIEVVRDSGFISLRYHNLGDQILADRGFSLVDHFAAACGAQHLVPPFTKGNQLLIVLKYSLRLQNDPRHDDNVTVHTRNILL